MHRKITVVHVIYGLKYGGAEKLLVPFSTRLDRTRYSVSVIALTCGGPLEDELNNEGVEVRVLRRDGKFGLGDLARLVGLLKEKKVDIVHTHLQNADIWAGVAAKVCGAKQVSTFHGIIRDEGIAGEIKLRSRVFLPDRIIAVSLATAKTCVEVFGARRDKVSVVYNGLDSDRFFPSERDPSRDETGIAVVGRLEKEKGVLYFLRAFAEVKRGVPRARGFIVGEGSLRKELEAKAAELGLHEELRFLGERVDVPDIMRSVDIVVMPSLMEGMSLVALEAMACGKPVVATRVGGTPELIDDGTNGILVPPADPHALASAILKLAGDRALSEKMGSQGRAKVMEQFSLEQMVRGIERIYVSLVEGCEKGDSA